MQPDHLTFCWPPPIILIVEDFGHENTECGCVYVSAYVLHAYKYLFLAVLFAWFTSFQHVVMYSQDFFY